MMKAKQQKKNFSYLIIETLIMRLRQILYMVPRVKSVFGQYSSAIKLYLLKICVPNLILVPTIILLKVIMGSSREMRLQVVKF